MLSSIRFWKTYRTCLKPIRILCRRQLTSAHPIQPVELKYDLLTPSNGNKQECPLVILHGLFGSKRNWFSLSKAFLRDLDRPIYSLDLRNSGWSPHSTDMTYPHMAEDVLHFCQKHELSNVTLLGHSMGGKTAMTLALHPDRPPSLLSHLIVVDIAPSIGGLSAEFKKYVVGMKKIESSRVRSRKEAQDILAEYERDPTVRAFLLTNLDTEGEYMRFRIPLDIIAAAVPHLGSFPFEPGERTWEGKTLFIKGERSNYINSRNIPLAKQFFPHMVLKSLDAAHWVHAEKPDEFRKLVNDFIKQPAAS